MFKFPRGLRPSTLADRRRFYGREFDVSAVSRWIGSRRRHLKFAMIPGRHTGICAPAHAADRDNVVVIDHWKSVRDLREYALEYLPEGMYYDRNRYVDVAECRACGDYPRRCPACYNYDGQQLAFDLDPENVDCPYHGDIGERMSRGRGLSFCMIEFKEVRRQASSLLEELTQEYDRIGIVYSGRGFHVLVDDESAYLLTERERAALARKFGKRYSIDEWITSGGSRLMRLPYSLNALVSRKCIPIKGERDLLGFDPRTDKRSLPRFVKSA